MPNLTPKQARFVQEYLIDLNATQAAIRAGYSKNSSNVEGSRLLANANIEAAINEALAKRERRTEITADRVLKELARIGLSDLRNVFTEAGHLKHPGSWDDATAAAIASVKVVTRPSGGVDDDGNKEVEHIHEIKMWDKNSALEKIAKHLGMFVDKHEHSGPNGAALQVQIVRFADNAS